MEHWVDECNDEFLSLIESGGLWSLLLAGHPVVNLIAKLHCLLRAGLHVSLEYEVGLRIQKHSVLQTY